MQFLIIARDNTDPGTPARRQAVRDEHLANLRRTKASGNYISAVAMLTDDGDAVGSVVVVDFPDRAALDAWLADEPYMREKVWDRVEIQPARVAPI